MILIPLALSDMTPNRSTPDPARRIWRTLRKIHLPGWFIAYEPGIRLQRFIMSRLLVQNLFYPQRLRLIREWAKLCSSSNVQDMIVGSLMVNTWEIWRNHTLKQPGVAASMLTVQGTENLKQAVARSSGTILVGLHTTRSGLIHHITRTLCQKELHSFGRPVPNSDLNLATATYARRLIDTQTLLKKGEIVAIGGDGLRGTVMLELPFYGRLFPFRSGFAELALRTGATALPVFVYFTMDGRITIEFSEAIQVSPGTRQEQIEQMIRQYAQMLVERWPRLITSLLWYKLEQVYMLPPVSSASPVQKG